MKATFIKEADGFREYAELFRLERPKTENGVTFEFIVVSAIKNAYDTQMPETYIFPADSRGEVVSWGKLEGSFRGAMEYLIVKKVGGDGKRYLDRDGGFGAKDLAYPMPRWLARLVLRNCFSYSDRFYIEEVR